MENYREWVQGTVDRTNICNRFDSIQQQIEGKKSSSKCYKWICIQQSDELSLCKGNVGQNPNHIWKRQQDQGIQTSNIQGTIRIAKDEWRWRHRNLYSSGWSACEYHQRFRRRGRGGYSGSKNSKNSSQKVQPQDLCLEQRIDLKTMTVDQLHGTLVA